MSHLITGFDCGPPNVVHTRGNLVHTRGLDYRLMESYGPLVRAVRIRSMVSNEHLLGSAVPQSGLFYRAWDRAPFPVIVVWGLCS